MREFLEDLAVIVCSSVVVLLFCIVYWLGRLCGVDLMEDF